MILKPIGNPLPTASACGLCLPLASGAPWPAHRAGWSPGLLLFPGAALNQGWVGLLDKHSSPLGYLRGIPHHLPDLLGRRELLSPTLLTCPFPPSFTSSWQFSSVQLLSCVLLFVTPWTAACQASLSITNSQSSPKLMSIESVIPSNHLILCRPLLLLPSIFPSIRVYSNESALRIRWLHLLNSYVHWCPCLGVYFRGSHRQAPSHRCHG